jgi:tetratricopeptide (TPR) repeat protein
VFAFAEGRLDAAAIADLEEHAAACTLCLDLFAVAMRTGTLHKATSGAHLALRPFARGSTMGRYTILDVLGRGGMGEVYAAYDGLLDRKVALKLVHAEVRGDPELAQARLLREAKALAKLSHENVVAVHDAGTFEGEVFVAMELVEGVALKQWLAERPRSRREILDVFAQAARGLAAAHAAGLVHRDFKPSNVMVGRDGSVRVTDFGLARSLTNPEDEVGAREPALPGAAGLPDLTHTGELLGTPLYMAPEQFLRQATDGRSDQFSFCVALYEALYGASPFGVERVDALGPKVLAGRVDPAPPNTFVPTWLRRVLLRGLSAAPEARWPSMDALLVALRSDPARARRRVALSIGAVTLVALAAIFVVRGASRPAQLCLAGPPRLAEIWGDAAQPGKRRAAVEKAFLASDVPGAPDIWRRITAVLDQYRERWLGMYRDACEATHVRHQQPAKVLDLRMACLEETRTAFAALTNVLAGADRDVVMRAVDGANGLPALDRCANVKELESVVEPPRDTTTRQKVDDLRARTATAKALSDTGKHEEARQLFGGFLVEARALGYRPLIAEILVAISRTYYSVSFRVDAIKVTEEAAWTSLASGRDDLATEAFSALVCFAGFHSQFEDGEKWSRLARAALARTGGQNELLLAWLLTNEGNLAYAQHDWPKALERFEGGLALKEKVLPPNHPDITAGLNNVSNSLARLGRVDEALRMSGRAHDLYVQAYGPASTEAAFSLSNHSEHLLAAGRTTEALDAARTALRGWQAQVGESYVLGYPLIVIGSALLELGRPQEALAPLERALKLREPNVRDARLIAKTRFVLARALWDSGTNRARARALAEQARDGFVGPGTAKERAGVEAWLTSHARR